ncbi:MAG: aminoacyl-histidine dipeptidase [Mogibacterium sp.]|nr:aminoacyl-histidine dipeptidase [Mogibacterium sp.]
MDTKLNLEPKAVFGFFERIASIPHGSHNTKAISDYLVDFAKERGLEYFQDDINNVVISKAASKGYEDAEPIIIQGHIDMVCEQTPGSSIDMTKEGLELYVDGNWLRAKDTTLGGDDGIAVAMALAVLDSNEYKHPKLYCIFTVDEEVGLLGAAALDVSKIDARKMINIDSEDEGIITVSCAGGITAKAILPVSREKSRGISANICIDGLLGGHSGIEIDKEHGNANNLMGRLLYELAQSVEYKLVKAEGGSKDNAICKKSDAEIVIEAADVSEVKSEIAKIESVLTRELRATDPDVRLSVEIGEEKEVSAFDEVSKDRLITWLMNSPSGVQHMSKEIEGLVETSLNLGALNCYEEEATACYAVRSSVNSRRDYLCKKLDNLANMLGGAVEYSGEYPGWEYRADSKLRDICVEVFKSQYGREPEVKAIHAGLECGLFAGKMDDGRFDAVSIGPDMEGVHTTDEKLSISSVERTWKYLLGILEACE